jgi:hypothetical protein
VGRILYRVIQPKYQLVTQNTLSNSLLPPLFYIFGATKLLYSHFYHIAATYFAGTEKYGKVST